MRVLVTGGAGYIGSHLVDHLFAEGHEVVVVDDLSTGRRENITHLLDEERFRFVEGDICNPGLVADLVASSDLVYHLAAAVGVRHILSNPLRGIFTNVEGTANVLKAAHLHKRRVLFASTSEVYGRSPHMPLKEDGDRVLGSTKITRWSYSTAKALGEHLCFAYYAEGLPVSIVRYFNSYGPRMDPQGYSSVVANFIMQALRGEPLTIHGDGQQSRCFTFVNDTVRGTVLAAEHPEALGEVFNIGSSVETTILELAALVLELTGAKSGLTYLPYEQVYGPNFEDPRRRVPDVSKARRVLGFQAQVPLREGLEETIRWFRRQYSETLCKT
ncbi:MAG: GDP-mannose 4,6-dehydratase [Chloroflexi bacterium]|nr:GDP-mannose 4,6-dehydratase [Chloroflexota bacterium]